MTELVPTLRQAAVPWALPTLRAVHKLAGALLSSPTGWLERRRLRKGDHGQELASIRRDAARLATVLLGGRRADRAS